MLESRGLPCGFVTTTMFNRIQHGGMRVNGISTARKIVYDHSLMAMAEKFTGSIGVPADNAMNFMLQQGHITTTNYIDVEWMNYTGMGNMTLLQMAEKAMIQPLTEVERNPRPLNYYDTMQGVGVDDIVVKARSYAEAEYKFNTIAMMNRGSGLGPDSAKIGTNDGLGFYGNFGDALPLVGPTRELVDKMMMGSQRSRYNSQTGAFEGKDEVIGWMKLMGGTITIEKVAVNAVMAGAKPEQFPVILAAFELFAGGFDYDKMWYHGLSTGSDSTLYMLVNGPIGKELGISGSDGFAAGAGNEANNVIGRAIRMGYRNIGHMTLYIDDHQYKGRENDHTLSFFREEEEFLPNWDPARWNPSSPRGTDMWVPYHVECGFRPEESTITIWAGNALGALSFAAGATGAGTGNGGTNFWTSTGLSNFGTVTGGAIDFFTVNRAMAKTLYEQRNITTKDSFRGTSNNTNGYRYVNNPVIAGSELSPVRTMGGYSFYNRQNHQINLISGAVYTQNGKAASAITNKKHVGIVGGSVTSGNAVPATTAVPGGAYAPSAPRNLQVRYEPGTVAGRQNAILTWDAPVDNGGSPIIAYQIAFSHAGALQWYDITDAPSGYVELGNSAYPGSGSAVNAASGLLTYVSDSYSYYNHNTVNGTIVKVSGADRIYNICDDSAAFAAKTFTFRNIPGGFETFFRVRAVNALLTALEVEGNDIIAANVGEPKGFGNFSNFMTPRYSGRGTWLMEDGGRGGHIVPVTKVDTKIVEPAAGATPATRPTTTTVGVLCGDIAWTPALVNGKFAGGTAYTATFTIKDKLGTLFNSTDTGIVSVSGMGVTTTNGSLVNSIQYLNSVDTVLESATTPNAKITVTGTGDTRTVSYTFNKTNRMETAVTLSMPAPVAGGLNDAAARNIQVLTGGATVSITTTPWTPSVTAATGVFQNEQAYTVTFTLTPTSGNMFPPTLADLSVKVNGNDATVTAASGSARTVTYTFPQTAPKTELKVINVAIPQPATAGTNDAAARTLTMQSAITAEDVTIASPGTTVISPTISTTPFTPPTGAALANSGTFAANTVYTLTFTLAPGSAYKFPTVASDLVVNVNGRPATVTVVAATPANRTITIALPATLPARELASVALTMPAPVLAGTNNAAARTMTIAGGTVAGGDPAVAPIVTYSVATTGTPTPPWTPTVTLNTGTFAADTAYTFTFTITPTAAYTFPANLTDLAVTVNDIPATVTAVSGTGRTVTVTFPKTAPLTLIDEVNLTMPAPVTAGTNNAAARTMTIASAVVDGATVTTPATTIVNYSVATTGTPTPPWTPSVTLNTGTFAPATAYMFTFTLTPGTLYTFPATLTSLVVKVNGRNATVTSVSGTNARTVTFLFDATVPLTVLDEVSVTMPVPATGVQNNAAARTITVQSASSGGAAIPSPFASVVTTGTVNSTATPFTIPPATAGAPQANGYFLAATTYQITFTLTPGGLYTFPATLAELVVKVNGQTATVSSVSGTNGRTITFIFEATAPVRTLDTVNFTMPYPVGGGLNNAAARTITIGTISSIDSIALPTTAVSTTVATTGTPTPPWTPSVALNTGTFLAGTEYMITFTLNLGNTNTTMYAFPATNDDLHVNVNGFPATVSGSGTTRTIQFTFPPA